MLLRQYGLKVPKKVLISGGTGYLGRHLAKALVDEEVDILIRETSRRDILDKVNYVLKDDLEATYDCFIHMATAYGRKGESEEEIFATNKNLPLEVLRKIEKEGLVFINTDTSLPLGFNAYATSKKEFIEKAKSEFSGLKIINLICEQFYGPSDGTFVSFVKETLEKGKEVELTSGLQERDFIYIEDIVRAFCIVFQKADALDGNWHEFEVGSGEARSIREIGEMICSIMNKDQSLLKWGAKPLRDGEIMKSVADTTKLKNLGWVRHFSLEEGLKITVGEK